MPSLMRIQLLSILIIDSRFRGNDKGGVSFPIWYCHSRPDRESSSSVIPAKAGIHSFCHSRSNRESSFSVIPDLVLLFSPRVKRGVNSNGIFFSCHSRESGNLFLLSFPIWYCHSRPDRGWE